MLTRHPFWITICFTVLTIIRVGVGEQNEPLANTKSLEIEGDIAMQLVAGVDKFLLREIDNSVESRAKHWQRDYSSPENYNKSIEPNRKRLAHILGVRDERVAFDGLELISTTSQPALVGRGDGYRIYAVRWPVIRNIHGEGLLLVPDNRKAIAADVIAIPDADQTPEQIVGLTDGVAAESQFARWLVGNGCRVVVPALISRDMQRRHAPDRSGGPNLTNREFSYRASFELGRHLIGYELQKVLAVVDWFSKEAGRRNPSIGVIGYGEGGMLAMYAGALDTRIDATCVSGYFGPREGIWNQPIDRSVFGLLEQFGDAEVASMIASRALVIDSAKGPELKLPSEGGAPAELKWHSEESIKGEAKRLADLVRELKVGDRRADSQFVIDTTIRDDFCNEEMTMTFLWLTNGTDLQRGDPIPPNPLGDAPTNLRPSFDPKTRLQRQIREIDQHNQWLLTEASYVRRDFMNIGLTRHDRQDGANVVDTSSIEKYEESSVRFRDNFRHEVVGHFDHKLMPFHPRTRKAYDEAKWTGYEVVLDVFPDVIAYGVLLLPKDLKPGDKRPVVVCQHGLEGRPADVISGGHRAYHDFAAKLAERGFITFAPQNLYIGKDKFRTLQRKAYPLKKTLFSVIVPQHQQIINWLKTQPNVDPDRIAFYGLSYGGKSAMRIPSLVTDYCLSICSADFNEWVWKNASTRSWFTYMFTGEYEIFEFDLGSTFNYAEMAALIAPRPFMVERGHFDGVAPDEAVAYEFAKVRHLYAARLGLPDRCELEFFKGPHTINGQGTFDFLHKHLNWPEP